MTSNQVSATGLSTGEWLRSACHPLETRMGSSRVADEHDAAEISLAAQVLLTHVLGKSRAWVLAHPEAVLDWNDQTRLETLLQHLRLGTPLPYLTGNQEFFGLNFEVNPDVLIPRPETEILVERALYWVQSCPNYRQAADVGTGSGCIAISLATRAPQLRWLAVDRSWRALQVARRNATRHKVTDKVLLANADLLSACAGPLDLVCANLPYIPRETVRNLPVARYEPTLALDGGEDGLVLIRDLLGSARRCLAPGGVILLEMQFDQGEKIAQLAKTHLPDAQVTILPDLGGLPRVVEILIP